MSFNALSIAKLGLGFGAVAVASIGLLSPEVEQAQDSSGGALKVHSERIAKVQQYHRLLAAQKKSIEEKPVEIPALLLPQVSSEELARKAIEQLEEVPAQASETFEILPELVAKLAEIRQVSIEQVELPEIAPEHLALIRNNDDALAMILIYWGFEDEA